MIVQTPSLSKKMGKLKASTSIPVEKKYSFSEVYTSCIKYFNGDELAATTWMNKYAMKDKDGSFFERTPDDMHQRMAKEFARIEKGYKHKSKLNGSFNHLSKHGQERKL